MWVYEQLTGKLTHNDKFVAKGYSGNGHGLNNPLFQNVKGVGPLPQGSYIISEPYDSPTRGKFCMRLLPQPGTETYGRGDFLIHGDSIEFAGLMQASHGCIILDRATRQKIYDSDDVLLVVVSGVVA